LNVPGREVAHALLMGRAQDNRSFRSARRKSVVSSPRGLFPELDRLSSGADFLGANPVHFVADDALDLPALANQAG
jgi:hypothetical protein